MACVSRIARTYGLHHSVDLYREIQYGPFRGMPKRPYWEIIKGAEPVALDAIRSLKPELTTLVSP